MLEVVQKVRPEDVLARLESREHLDFAQRARTQLVWNRLEVAVVHPPKQNDVLGAWGAHPTGMPKNHQLRPFSYQFLVICVFSSFQDSVSGSSVHTFSFSLFFFVGRGGGVQELMESGHYPWNFGEDSGHTKWYLQKDCYNLTFRPPAVWLNTFINEDCIWKNVYDTKCFFIKWESR